MVVRGLNVLESGVAKTQGEAKVEPLVVQIPDMFHYFFHGIRSCMIKEVGEHLHYHNDCHLQSSELSTELKASFEH